MIFCKSTAYCSYWKILSLQACEAQNSGWTKSNVVVSYVDVVDVEAVVRTNSNGVSFMSQRNTTVDTFLQAYYVREKQLAGICLHSIDNDDFRNACCACKTKFPLTRTAFEILHGQQRSEKNDCLDPAKLNRLPLNAPCCW